MDRELTQTARLVYNIRYVLFHHYQMHFGTECWTSLLICPCMQHHCMQHHCMQHHCRQPPVHQLRPMSSLLLLDVYDQNITADFDDFAP